MNYLLLAALAAYVNAAVHAILAFAYKRRSVERVAIVSLGIGFALHTAAFVGDWVQDGHYPLFGLRETLSFLAWTLVVAYGLAHFRYQVKALGTFLMPLVAFLVTAAMLVRSSADMRAGTVAAGAAGWVFPIHTTLLIFSYAAFFVVFIASAMYLWQERELKLKTFSALFHRLPSLTTVDDIGSTAAGIGFTLLSLGIVTGAILSSQQTGRIWHNDPKEVFALITWLLYLTMIHYRIQWRGRKSALVGVAGFGLVLFTFLGTRLMGGYHVFG
ncbi:MAG TPA: cytochrome c biogenesis protein CcsA [Pyrinomonadaceae bacterium]|jgi:cytochrome c-type biogenesis protein CcsB|nr:cytochrome c biogenesis protein CcsA [Pyrinomonadaceae bacterium]